MKTLRHILFMVTALVLAVACTADGDLTATSGPDALTLSGSGDAVLSAKAKASLALTLHWNDNSKMKTNDRRVLLPDYATVNTLQFSASDNFAESVDQPLNKGETSRQYTVEELNSIAGRVGLEGDKASPLYVRVRSTLADNMPPTYSNTYTMRVTPYTIDMTRGVVLNSGREDTGLLLASKASDGVYSGFLGVDMLVYRRPDGSAAVHPFIELNLRYTMGLVAVELSRRVVHPDAIGRLLIARCPAPGDALRAHQADSQRLPARFADGRLRTGYLSLVPVTPASLFRAFIEVV